MKFDIPNDVIYIINKLQEKHSAYLVGGCIRDLICEKTPHDWDICTSALPEEVMSYFDEVIPTGLKHGTVSVLINKEIYEITTYRQNEIYDNSHIPVSVDFNTDKDGIYADLARRDFTINALAYDPINDEIIDPFNGYEDLTKNKVIKCVGNANERFIEDPLRMLRAIRFACYFKDFKIDKSTFKAIIEEKERLKVISAERIYAEIKKMLESRYPKNMMMLHFSELDTVFFPEFAVACECVQNHPYHKASVGMHIIDTVVHASSDYVIRFAALFHDLGKPLCKTMDSRGDHFYGHPNISKNIADDIMNRWKFSNEDKKIISNLVLEHDTLGYVENRDWNVVLKQLMFKYDKGFVGKLIKLSKADLLAHSNLAIINKFSILENIEKEYYDILKNNEPYKLTHLVVNGNDVIDKGFKGELVGHILYYIMMDIIKYPENNTREYILSNSNFKRYVSSAKNKLKSSK